MRKLTQQSKRLLKFIEKNKRKLSPLLILAHNYPDPDAISAAYALKYLLEKKYQISSKMAYGGVLGRMENREMVSQLHIPIRKLTKSHLKKYKEIALVDTQPAFENNSFPKRRKAAIVIDQHSAGEKVNADFSIIDNDCGATAVILANTLLYLGMDIPKPLATALVYGILTDTLNLYRVTRPAVIETYLKILPFCDLKALAKIQNPERSRKFFQTLGTGIQNAEKKRGLLTVKLGNVENPDLVAQVTDFLLSYRKATKAFCMGRYKGKIYTSLRLARQGTNAGNILRKIFPNPDDAGGHGTIAGGSIEVGSNKSEEHWKKTEDQLLQNMLKVCRISKKIEPYWPFRT